MALGDFFNQYFLTNKEVNYENQNHFTEIC
nr:MAG TPA: hypothetical protein [Caudoviricetes sp.]